MFNVITIFFTFTASTNLSYTGTNLRYDYAGNFKVRVGLYNYKYSVFPPYCQYGTASSQQKWEFPIDIDKLKVPTHFLQATIMQGIKK